MRVGGEYAALKNVNSDSQFLGDKAQASQAQGMAKTAVVKTTQSEKGEYVKAYRETYGLSTLAWMSDDEYNAFERATDKMAPNEKIQVAQSLHLVARSYKEAQKKLLGEEFALKEEPGYIKNNPDMLNKGIEVLSAMNNPQSKNIAKFLTRLKVALISPPINVVI